MLARVLMEELGNIRTQFPGNAQIGTQAAYGKHSSPQLSPPRLRVASVIQSVSLAQVRTPAISHSVSNKIR